MARIPVIALALLALAGTASAEFFQEDTADHHPFAVADPDVWLPILRDTGDVQAAQAAAAESLETYYGLQPLGDANKDGAEDVVRITIDHDDSDDVLIEAISGRDLETVLWDFEVRRGFAYIGGDYNEDGVYDLVTGEIDYQDSQRSTSRGWVYELDGQTEYEVLDGRDGKLLFELDAPFHAFVHSEGNSIIVADEGREEYVVEISSLTHGLLDAPGADLFHLRLSDVTDYRYTILLESHYDWEFSITTGISRYTLDGDEMFSVGAPDNSYGFLDAARDVDGDGLSELLFTYTDPLRMGYSSTLLRGEEREPAPAPYTVLYVDGATGETIFTEESEPMLGYAYASFVGNIYGDGETIAFSTYDDRSTITLFDLQGNEVDTHEDRDHLFLGRLGDVNGDGLDELALVESDGNDGRLGAADNNLQFIWSKHFDDDDSALFLPWDFDGDGIRDVGTEDERDEEVSLLSGATGETLWTFEFDETIVGLDFVQDIGRDGGHDILMLAFPDADEETEEYADLEGFLHMYDGATLELLWTKLAYQPDFHEDITATNPYVYAHGIGDLSGDRGHDLIINVGSIEFYSFTFTCSGSFTGSNCEYEEHGPDGIPLSTTMIVAGGNGETLLRYDNMPTEELSPEELATLMGAEQTEAGVELQSSLNGGLTPFGLSLLLVGSIIGAVAVGYLLRRKVTADA